MNSIAKTTPAGNDPFACGDAGDVDFLAANAVEVHEECGLPLADHCVKGCDECPRTPGPCYCDAEPATVEELLLGAALEQRYVSPIEITTAARRAQVAEYYARHEAHGHADFGAFVDCDHEAAPLLAVATLPIAVTPRKSLDAAHITKLVADFVSANMNGKRRPGVDRIAAGTGLARGTVRNYVKHMFGA